MERMLRAGALALLVVPLLLPLGSGQDINTNLLAFNLETSTGENIIEAPIGGAGVLELTLHDVSNDSPNPLIPGQGQDTPGVIGHSTRFEVIPVEEKVGWAVQLSSYSKFTVSGQSVTLEVTASAFPVADSTTYPFTILATMTGNGMETNRSISLVARTPGMEVFSAQLIRSYQVGPGDIVTMEFEVQNNAIYPRVFDADLAQNPCNAWVTEPRAQAIAGQTKDTLSFGVRAPSDKFWYQSESCGISFNVYSVEDPTRSVNVIVSMTVNGFYIAPEFWIWTTIIIVVAVFVILLVRRQKSKVEEEILGKPQAPWTIPAEAMYLDRLKAKDNRAWYLVRHFLMTEEHQSALLWYKYEKRGTKGSRSKERLVVKQEHRVERKRARWAKKVDKVRARPARNDATLQRKLDRKARGGYRKQSRTHRKQVKKLTAKHDERVEKATEKWEKQARRAQKRGQPLPDQPNIRPPDLPPEPSPAGIALSEHRWQRKADRYRGRMDRKAVRMEARLERKEARLLRKVRRKVRRVARKLDDPQFVAEHPLLAEPARG